MLQLFLFILEKIYCGGLLAVICGVLKGPTMLWLKVLPPMALILVSKSLFRWEISFPFWLWKFP